MARKSKIYKGRGLGGAERYRKKQLEKRRPEPLKRRSLALVAKQKYPEIVDWLEAHRGCYAWISDTSTRAAYRAWLGPIYQRMCAELKDGTSEIFRKQIAEVSAQLDRKNTNPFSLILGAIIPDMDPRKKSRWSLEMKLAMEAGVKCTEFAVKKKSSRKESRNKSKTFENGFTRQAILQRKFSRLIKEAKRQRNSERQDSM